MSDVRADAEVAAEQVDLLFFEVGNAVYGADASQVLRIDRALPDDFSVPELGVLRQGARALVFQLPEGEGHLRVDAVRGVRPVPLNALRRMPPPAGAPPYAVGLCLDAAEDPAQDSAPVLLIDLAETVNSAV
ncbi:Frizzy aggregation protein FrzB [Aggregicoccus sp. 17bor-14]|uniref:Frizzy aggregation protein FrzB n=1 Tax=Myxococcaceae TaxID=31 RepID=UPI003519FE7D